MKSIIPKPLVDLLNKCEAGQRIMLFTVPLRVVRILATDDSLKMFRVEQLTITHKDPNNPRGVWSTLSTHGSEVPGQSWAAACEHAVKAQHDLRTKLMKKAQARQKTLMVPA